MKETFTDASTQEASLAIGVICAIILTLRLSEDRRRKSIPSRCTRRRSRESNRKSIPIQRIHAVLIFLIFLSAKTTFIQVTVGSPSRAETIARLLDQGEHSDHHGDVYRPVPAVFRLASERGFLTITGRFRGVPISIVSIGMGYPNMDFFVREVRECVEGDLVIVRYASSSSH